MAPLGISSGLMHTSWIEGGPAIQGSEYSINFNGTNGYLDTGDTYQSTFRGSFTISTWVNLVDGGYLFGGVRNTSSTHHAVHLRVMGNGKITLGFTAGGGGTYIETNSAVFTDGQTGWHNITLVVTLNSSANTTFVLYKNSGIQGITVHSGAVSDTQHAAYTTSDNPYIGAVNLNGSASGFTDGNMDDFAIWNVALDADAVAAMYNSGVPFDLTSNSGNYDNSGDLVGYWRFNEGSGTTALDTGGSNNATLVGGATYSNDNV
jgi:hypothetical protein